MQLSPTSKLIFRFLIHIFVGGFLFAAVALAATVLWYATAVMREHHVPELICWICELVSELLFFFGRYLPAIPYGSRGLEATTRCLGDVAGNGRHR